MPVAKAPPFAEPKSVALQQVSRVGRRGLEPRTYGLKVRSSTIELATQRTNKSMKVLPHIANLGSLSYPVGARAVFPCSRSILCDFHFSLPTWKTPLT